MPPIEQCLGRLPRSIDTHDSLRSCPYRRGCRPPPDCDDANDRSASLLRDLRLGIGVLVFRLAALRTRSFTHSRLARLVLLNVCIALALHAIDFEVGVGVYGIGALAIIAPILLFMLGAEIPMHGVTERGGRLRVLGGFYGALPFLTVVSFVLARMDRGTNLVLLGVEALVGLWALAILYALVRMVAGTASGPRWAVAVAILVGTWLVPMHMAARARMFFPSVREWEEPAEAADRTLEANAHLNELTFMQAERLRAAESTLAPERPQIADLYFIGGAGWADQDVFLREARSARALFDDRLEASTPSFEGDPPRDASVPPIGGMQSPRTYERSHDPPSARRPTGLRSPQEVGGELVAPPASTPPRSLQTSSPSRTGSVSSMAPSTPPPPDWMGSRSSVGPLPLTFASASAAPDLSRFARSSPTSAPPP